MSWLKRIQDEAGGVTEDDVAAVVPEEEPKEGETVVGAVEIEISRYFYLARRCDAKVLELRGLAQISGKEKRMELESEARDAEGQAGLLREIFWRECCDKFSDLKGKKEITVHQGWKISWSEGSCGVNANSLFAVLARKMAEGGSEKNP
ncbi:MAG: hypothetical protein WAW90_03015 [Minisyncoccia bacterium]